MHLHKPNPFYIAWSNQQKGIGLYENVDISFISLKLDGAISTLNGKPLKIVDQFTYLGSNISSTKSVVCIHIGKTLTAIDKLSIIEKYDLFDGRKRDFF